MGGVGGLSLAGEEGESLYASTSKELRSFYPDNDGFMGEVSKITLQKGTEIDRYGFESGKYVSPKGTPFSMRSLHPSALERSYNSYKVIKPFDVMSGRIAPYYGQMGFGTQHVLPQTVSALVDDEYIERM